MATSESTTAPATINYASLTMTIAQLCGKSLKMMSEAEEKARQARRAHKEGEDGAFACQCHFDREAKEHFRRADNAHELIADLPASTLAETTIITAHVLGYLYAVDGVEIAGEDAAFIRANVDRAITGMKTVVSFLAIQSGINLDDIGLGYYAGMYQTDIIGQPATDIEFAEKDEGRVAA